MVHVGCNAVEKMPWAYFLFSIYWSCSKSQKSDVHFLNHSVKKEVLEMQNE